MSIDDATLKEAGLEVWRSSRFVNYWRPIGANSWSDTSSANDEGEKLLAKWNDYCELARANSPQNQSRNTEIIALGLILLDSTKPEPAA